MLARILKIWLIVSIFGYGLVLAADIHGELSVDHAVQLLDDNSSVDDTADDGGCHHCAHGISHLLGLSYLGETLPADTRCRATAFYHPLGSSFSPPSLLRPPISS
jgi:hypothetical protein